MSDLIKREDAIRAVAEVLSLNRFASFKNIKDFGRFAERMLRNVPSADRPQGWISCSERMPKGPDGISECEMVLMTLSVGYVACGWINGDTAYVLINNPVLDQIAIADSKDVLAWMPLPEPFNADRKTE